MIQMLAVAALTTVTMVACSKETERVVDRPVIVQAGEPDLVAKKKELSNVDFTLDVAANEIKIMAYNVENYFDAVHDPDHDDWTYLPKNHPDKNANCKKMAEGAFKKECFNTDWTEQVVALKTEQIARVVEYQGPTPDVLAVEEIENLNVANQLGKRLGYQPAFLTKGSDGRGINNALLYKDDKLEFISSDSIIVGGSLNKHTRDILVVRFKVKGTDSVLGVYVNHWPSQSNPSTDRVLAANTLKDQIDADTKVFGTSYHAVAVGDFNTITTDEPHPFSVIQNESWVNNLVSIDNVSENLGEFGYNTGKLDAKVKAVRNAMPMGTYLFRHDWQYLDYIFVTRNLFDKSGFDVQPETFRVLPAPFASEVVKMDRKDKNGALRSEYFLAPKGLNIEAAEAGDVGSSDHFPIVVRFKVN